MDFLECSYLPNGYLVNSKGDIKSPNGVILKKFISNSGYYFINIKNKGYFIHRALSFAFIDKKEGKDFVNHIDGNKLNNELSNLEWCSKSENTIHCYKMGLKKETINKLWKGKTGELHNRSKKVICIEDGLMHGSMSEAERYYKIGQGCVSWSIKNKKPIFGMHFEIGS